MVVSAGDVEQGEPLGTGFRVAAYLVVDGAKASRVQAWAVPFLNKAILPGPDAGNVALRSPEVGQIVGALIDQLTTAGESYDAKGGILAVDGRDGRIDQNELRIVFTPVDDAKVIGVIVAGEHGDDGGLIFGHEVPEEAGPIGLPHRDNGSAAQVFGIRSLGEGPVAGHG